ncbi:hypothetical protein FA10DRAFT_150552 [Acaromyces ingoldii]|uniref:Uncharacterized protein n=1 Tax=Acaromyces ingoldii TaxID=215250 RepID=A0A316YJR3_9BASI|nr:hypothetical protein FA10DRAFT_150552 [Acaromyces ingoldii]PWN89657.1 hypothetical protein FA10DRAFT_150552 [Acaromyces ingoldii]
MAPHDVAASPAVLRLSRAAAIARVQWAEILTVRRIGASNEPRKDTVLVSSSTSVAPLGGKVTKNYMRAAQHGAEWETMGLAVCALLL